MNHDTGFELRKFVAPEFVYGIGARKLIGRYARNLGARKALVVTDPGLVQAGWVEQALDSLNAENISWVLFQDVTPNPKDYEVAAGVQLYRDNDCDMIIAVGGGSPMDCAKGIGVAYTNGKNVVEFEGVDEVQMPGPPLVCVPTTAGSSADVSQFAIISDTARKLKISIISKKMVPDVALIDPETTTTLSEELTAITGLDALAHAFEAYVSNASSPVTDLNALGAVPLLVQNLVPAIENPRNMEYRGNMMLGSLLAGLAFSNASLGLLHAIGHSLGSLQNLPHGLCSALLLDPVLDFNYQTVAERYDRIGQAMGLNLGSMSPEVRKEALIRGVASLRERAGIKTTFGAQGITRDDIRQLAINAFNDPCITTNPRKASVQEIGSLYEQILSA
jgi:alcohol dehydrogenase